MAQAKPRIKENLLLLSNEDWMYLINNYLKSETDRIIAKRYYLDGIPQIEIAEEVHYSRSTIKNRLPKIINILEKASQKMTKS